MSETDISTAAVEAHAKRLRDHGHSGTHGILPVTLALLADRDRLQRENDNLRQIERNVQAVREHEHKRANAAEAERDRLAAEVARLREALRQIDIGQSAEPDHWKFRVRAREIARAALAQKQHDRAETDFCMAQQRYSSSIRSAIAAMQKEPHHDQP